MVTSKSNHVQRKPVANHISVKFYRFCYFYNFWRLWEFITYSHWQLSRIAHHKSNLKQEKLTSECVFINIYSFYNFGEAWEFFDLQVVHKSNLAGITAVCAPVKIDYFGQFHIFERPWEFVDYLAQPFLRYLITISAGLALQRSVGKFLGWQLGHSCPCLFFKLRHMPGDAGNGTGQLPAL